MTPKDKARELVIKFMPFADSTNEFRFAKQCALKCVEEILDATKISYAGFVKWINGKWETVDDHDVYSEYWQQVKQEIENA